MVIRDRWGNRDGAPGRISGRAVELQGQGAVVPLVWCDARLSGVPVGACAVKLEVKIGDVVTIKEADYYFGYGDVTLRITALPEERLPSGSEWLQISGIPIYWNGQEGEERTALVRASALNPM